MQKPNSLVSGRFEWNSIQANYLRSLLWNCPQVIVTWPYWTLVNIVSHMGLLTWGNKSLPELVLTHWGRVTHKCVSKLTIIGSDNGLSPDRRQAIIWTNAGILLIGPLGTNFSEILIKILTFSFKKMRLKVSSAKRRPFCPSLNVLTELYVIISQPVTSAGHTTQHWYFLTKKLSVYLSWHVSHSSGFIIPKWGQV